MIWLLRIVLVFAILTFPMFAFGIVSISYNAFGNNVVQPTREVLNWLMGLRIDDQAVPGIAWLIVSLILLWLWSFGTQRMKRRGS